MVGWKNLTGTNLGFAAPMMKHELEVLLIPTSLVNNSVRGNVTGFATTIPITQDASSPSLDIRYWTGSLSIPDVCLCYTSDSAANTTEIFEMFWNIKGDSSDPAYRMLLGNMGNAGSKGPSWLGKTRINRLGVAVVGLPLDDGSVACNQRMAATNFMVNEQGMLVW